MKINMKILRWILLILYIAIVIGIIGMSFHQGENLNEKLFWPLFLLTVTVISQVLLIFGAGTVNLCTPVRPRRLVLPVIVAALMMTVLVGALCFCLIELLYLDDKKWSVYAFWIIVGLSWILWSAVFFIRYRDTERYKILRNLVAALIAGSLIELFVAIPSHVIVSKRPGCFVGIGTGLGIISGIFVMLWAFGPGVILLFLRERRKAELQRSGKIQ